MKRNLLLEKIERYMREKNLTQKQLAQRFGIAEGTLSKWLSGTHQPSALWTQILEEKLG